MAYVYDEGDGVFVDVGDDPCDFYEDVVDDADDDVYFGRPSVLTCCLGTSGFMCVGMSLLTSDDSAY